MCEPPHSQGGPLHWLGSILTENTASRLSCWKRSGRLDAPEAQEHLFGIVLRMATESGPPSEQESDVGGTSPPPGIGLAYDTAVSKLAAQLHSIDQFDAKVAPLVALLGLTAAGYVAAARGTPERALGGVVLASAIVSVLVAYFIRDYADAPRAETFASYAGYEPDRMKSLFLEAVLSAISDNRRLLKQKALALKLGLILLGLGSLAVIATVALGFDGRVLK